MKLIRAMAGLLGAAVFAVSGAGLAQQPIKIGMSMPQTGSLGGGG